MLIGHLWSDFGGLEPGRTSGEAILARFGRPAEEWHNEDGSVTWEYPQGPEGITCHMLTLDASRVLTKVEQVLSEPYFARVRRGWTHDRVRRLLGRPRTAEFFPLKREEVWDWRIASVFPNTRALFNVHFDENGIVIGTSRTEENPPG